MLQVRATPLTCSSSFCLYCPFKVYEQSRKIQTFKALDGAIDIDLNAAVATTYQLTPTSTVTIIDPYEEYVSVLKQCFDFDALKKFMAERSDFSVVFDGMHGAGGPFARRVLVEELGLPEVRTGFNNFVQ